MKKCDETDIDWLSPLGGEMKSTWLVVKYSGGGEDHINSRYVSKIEYK
jgi:hypothetical protein